MIGTRVVSWALGVVFVIAAGGRLSAADVSAGRALAEGCAACHGADGAGQMVFTPSPAGQVRRIRAMAARSIFAIPGCADERRDNRIGSGGLSNQDIRDLGAYYASLSPPQPATAPGTLAQKGEQIALQHRCRSCHGDDYNGFRAAARLSGQREDVMVKALHDFKSGKRVGSGVASMADVTYELNDADMEALSHYMATRR